MLWRLCSLLSGACRGDLAVCESRRVTRDPCRGSRCLQAVARSVPRAVCAAARAEHRWACWRGLYYPLAGGLRQPSHN